MLTVVESIRRADAVNRFGPALIGPGGAIAYGQLLDLVARVANILDERKIPRLAKVYVNIADRDAKLIVTIGCMHYGLIPYVVGEIGDIRDDMEIDYIIGGAQLDQPAIAPDFVIDQAALDAAPAGLRDFPDRSDDDILYISTSTGTTGKRKLIAEMYGVFKNRAGMGDAQRALVRTATDFWSTSDSDRVLPTIGGASPYGFNSIMWILGRRSALVRDQRSAADTVALINRAGVTRLLVTPAGIERFLDHMEQAGIRCPSVNLIALVGSLFQAPLLARIERNFDAQLMVSYGTNEVGRVSAGTVSAATYQPGYVGELHPELAATGTGTREAPAQLAIANRSATFANYYARGKLTKVEIGPYTLPDLGFVEGRSVYLIGRDDEVHNVSGNKVAFSTIDAELRKAAGVRDIGIVGGMPIGQPNDLYIAVSGEGVDLGALMDRVVAVFNSSAARSNVHIFAVDEVKRNATGKVERGALLDAYRAKSI